MSLLPKSNTKCNSIALWEMIFLILFGNGDKMKDKSRFIQSIKTFLDFHIKECGNQKKLADICGTSPANISRWVSEDEEKKRIPRMEDFAPVLDHFGIVLEPQGLTNKDCPRCKEMELEIVKLRAQVSVLQDTLNSPHRHQQEKAPAQEASGKDAKFYLLNGTEGE